VEVRSTSVARGGFGKLSTMKVSAKKVESSKRKVAEQEGSTEDIGTPLFMEELRETERGFFCSQRCIVDVTS